MSDTSLNVIFPSCGQCSVGSCSSLYPGSESILVYVITRSTDVMEFSTSDDFVTA